MTDDRLRELERLVSTGDLDAAWRLHRAREQAGLCVFHGEDFSSCASCAGAAAIDWQQVFGGQGGEQPGADDWVLEELTAEVARPLNKSELKEARRFAAEVSPGVVPETWVLSELPLPPSYLSFLRWSNGGEFIQGERLFQFFATSELRFYLLRYQIPEHMPKTLPIAFDGGGTFYLLDLRSPPVAGEYPVLFSHAGSLSFEPESCTRVASSFLEACLGVTDLAGGGDRDRYSAYPERCDVWLVRPPKTGLKGLIGLKKALQIEAPIRELKAAFDALPARLLSAVKFTPTAIFAARFNREDPCLEVRGVESADAFDLGSLDWLLGSEHA